MKKILLVLAFFASISVFGQSLTLFPPNQGQVTNDTIPASFMLAGWPNGTTKVRGEAFIGNLHYFSDSANVTVSNNTANGLVYIDTLVGSTAYQVRMWTKTNGGAWVQSGTTITVTTAPDPQPLDIFEPPTAVAATYGFTVYFSGNSIGYYTNPTLYYRPVGGNFISQPVPLVTGANYTQQVTVTSLQPATAYEYFITGQTATYEPALTPVQSYDQTNVYPVTTLPTIPSTIAPYLYVDATETTVIVQANITSIGSSGSATYWHQLLQNGIVVQASPQYVTSAQGYTPAYYFTGLPSNSLYAARTILQDGSYLDTTSVVPIVTDQIPLPTIHIDSVTAITKHTAIAWVTVNPGSTFPGSTTTVTGTLSPLGGTVPSFTTTVAGQFPVALSNLTFGTNYTLQFPATNSAGTILSNVWTFHTLDPFPAVQFNAQPVCFPQTNSIRVEGLTAFSTSWTGGNSGKLYRSVNGLTPVLRDSTTTNLSAFNDTTFGLLPNTDNVIVYTWVNADSILRMVTLNCHTLFAEEPMVGVYANDNGGYVDSASVVIIFSGVAGGYPLTNCVLTATRTQNGQVLQTVPIPDQGPDQFSYSIPLQPLPGGTQITVKVCSANPFVTQLCPQTQFCTYGALTGTSETTVTDVSVYPSPSPSGGTVTVRGLPQGTYSAALVDAIGRIVPVSGVQAGTVALPTVQPGFYTLMLVDKGRTLTKRIIIE